MGLVLQLAGILVAFPIGMGFIYNENQAIIPLFVTSFAFFFVGFPSERPLGARGA